MLHRHKIEYTVETIGQCLRWIDTKSINKELAN